MAKIVMLYLETYLEKHALNNQLVLSKETQNIDTIKLTVHPEDFQ